MFLLPKHTRRWGYLQRGHPTSGRNAPVRRAPSRHVGDAVASLEAGPVRTRFPACPAPLRRGFDPVTRSRRPTPCSRCDRACLAWGSSALRPVRAAWPDPDRWLDVCLPPRPAAPYRSRAARSGAVPASGPRPATGRHCVGGGAGAYGRFGAIPRREHQRRRSPDRGSAGPPGRNRCRRGPHRTGGPNRRHRPDSDPVVGTGRHRRQLAGPAGRGRPRPSGRAARHPNRAHSRLGAPRCPIGRRTLRRAPPGSAIRSRHDVGADRSDAASGLGR